MTAQDSLRSDWTASVFSSTLTDLVVIYESLASDLRMN
jgi:hypothetical protein